MSASFLDISVSNEILQFSGKKSRGATDPQKELLLGKWCSYKRRENEVSTKIWHNQFKMKL